jgi:hypothetical protein
MFQLSHEVSARNMRKILEISCKTTNHSHTSGVIFFKEPSSCCLLLLFLAVRDELAFMFQLSYVVLLRNMRKILEISYKTTYE